MSYPQDAVDNLCDDDLPSESKALITDKPKLCRFFLFSGRAYYPMGGFADFDASFPSMDAAVEAAKEAYARIDDGWAQVIDAQTGKQVFGIGGSCHFNFEDASA